MVTVRKHQVRSKHKEAPTVICTIAFHPRSEFQANDNIFQQSVTQWSPRSITKYSEKKNSHTLETLDPIQSLKSHSKADLAQFSDCLDMFKYPTDLGRLPENHMKKSLTEAGGGGGWSITLLL